MSKFRVGDRVRRNVESMGDIFQVILKDTGKSKDDIFIIKGYRGGEWASWFFVEGSDQHTDDNCWALAEEKSSTVLTADELLEYIKTNGTTKVRTTKGWKNIPCNTILFFDKYSDEDYIKSNSNKNEQYNYNFDYIWGSFWHDNYEGKFELIEPTSPKEKLIETKMEEDEIKQIPKAILKEANKEILEEIADKQKEEAKAYLRIKYERKAELEKETEKARTELDSIVKDLGIIPAK